MPHPDTSQASLTAAGRSDRDPAQGAARRHRRGARRQVDLAPGADVRGAGGRPHRDRGAARRRGRAGDRGGAARDGRRHRARRGRALAGRRGRGRRSRRAGGRARSRQFRHLGAAAARHPGDPPADRVCHRRRLAAAPADAAGHRPVVAVRGAVRRARGRPAAARGDRRGRPGADRIPSAGAVGAGQIGGAAGRAQHARRHKRDRERADPRPHRAHASAFRRDGPRRAASPAAAAAFRSRASRS